MTSTGKSKAELLAELETVFIARGFNANDVSSVSSALTFSSSVVDIKPQSRDTMQFLQLPPPSSFDVREEGRSARWESFIKEFNVYTSAIGLVD